jgi:hypothetical protein
MVYVLAMERGWHPQRDVNFAIKGDFKSTARSCFFGVQCVVRACVRAGVFRVFMCAVCAGLRDGVNDNSTAAFLWETFTTKPFHDSGVPFSHSPSPADDSAA